MLPEEPKRSAMVAKQVGPTVKSRPEDSNYILDLGTMQFLLKIKL